MKKKEKKIKRSAIWVSHQNVVNCFITFKSNSKN